MIELIVLIVVSVFGLVANCADDLVLITRRNGDYSNLKCVTTNFEKAIAWETPMDIKYSHVSVTNTYTEFPLDKIEIKNKSAVLYSVNGFHGPVMDSRWEKFTTHSTNGNNSLLLFKRIDTINVLERFQLSFSVLLECEAHIYICQDENATSLHNTCYWIILAGWNGTESVIRKCDPNEINPYNESPGGNCSRNLINVKGNLWKRDQWNHFTVSFEPKNQSISIQFSDSDKPFLRYSGKEFGNNTFSSIYVGSRFNMVGFWKFHKYDYVHVTSSIKDLELFNITGNQICFSMFIFICKNCQMTIRIVHPNNTEKEEILNGDANWKFYEYKGNYTNKEATYFIYVDIDLKDSAGSVEISNVLFGQNCRKSNMLRYSEFPTVLTKDLEKFKCGYLNDNSTKYLKSDPQKPNNWTESFCNSTEHFGTKCLSCSSIGVDICKDSFLCEYIGDFEQCYCPAGFEGEYCQSVILPVINEAPKLDEICYRDCRLSFNPRNYTPGQIVPALFEIEYHEVGSPVRHTERFNNFELHQITLRGLTKQTTYTARIILYGWNNRLLSAYNYDKDIPELTFNTSCKDLSQEDLTANTTSNTLSFIIANENNSNDRCDLDSYYHAIPDLNNATYDLTHKYTSLSPYKNYTVIFGKKRDGNNFNNFTMKIQTQQEDAPVTSYFTSELKIDEQTNSTIKISIQETENMSKNSKIYILVIGNHGSPEQNQNTKNFIEKTLKMELANEVNGHYSIYILKNKTVEGSNVIPNESNTSLLWYLLLLLLPIIIFIVYRSARKNKAKMPFNTAESNYEIPLNSNNIMESPEINSIQPEKPKSKFSKPINISEYQMYVKEAVFYEELELQYKLFSRGPQKNCDYGNLPENKSKNRYTNIVAYNHTRVHLKKMPNDDFSDYINANYIEGIQHPKAYIATQGPKPSTLDDFWRMVWDENVEHIVMLANVFENGRKKTEQYWPDYNEVMQFGSVSVEFVSANVFADYVVRVFEASKGDHRRKVEQLHFTAWPDHGVPLYFESLVPFIKKILAISQGVAPVLVHCSAGVGRTGTIILIDLCLRMAALTGTVDALHHLHQLREQRSNMVDTLNQYKLVHLVILECLLAPDTSLNCDEKFNESLKIVLESKIPEQMDYLMQTAWQSDAIRGEQERPKCDYPNKNRFNNITPSSYGAVYLQPYPQHDGTSNYINAVYVDGYKFPKRYFATQQPLPNTVDDFWRLAAEYEVSVIISLQELDQIFYPYVNDELIVTPKLVITHVVTEELQSYELIKLIMTHDGSQRNITIISMSGWCYPEVHPKYLGNLVNIWEQMNQLPWNENPIIITCRDGAMGCGLFTAMCFVFEKIKLERICDVCQAVRVTRRSREQFIQSKKQFLCLYKLAKLYLEEFELYKSISTDHLQITH